MRSPVDAEFVPEGGDGEQPLARLVRVLVELHLDQHPELPVVGDEDQIEAHLAGRRQPAITISDERDALLETGGGLVRARALLDGRLAPSVDDVLALAEPVLRHRMALNFAARADGVTVEHVIAKLCEPLR